ncbi:MAG TPA: tRNA preQ1(34) S-adenosylmethionine ribosyltransferase-isomerase QueA [Candidatus Eisenbacteria bacterium]|nr:tRNA preQ1(34) S-adenosylmethionine ribosyltransferase-isomerase QueA [Candidatus Eisenbacteria bacterium]
MRISEFDYQLPAALIAQRPLAERDASRMLLFDRSSGSLRDASFSEFAGVLRGDELLVFNNARVIPARLFGRRAGTHAQPPSRASAREHLTGTVEVLLTKMTAPNVWECLVRPGRKLPVGERVFFGQGELEAEIVSRGESGLRTVRLVSRDDHTPAQQVERLGHVPLPPYIQREDEISDRENYQTVFAKIPGAVAAPTAGLHFSAVMLERLRGKGIETCEITLDVGLGTFQPIHCETLEEHVMHEESYEISEATLQAVERARREKRPVVAIGTTVVRALEDSARRAMEGKGGRLLVAGRSEARIFITPGHEFQAVDGLLTNFHLPRSTLLALVCAFAGKEPLLAAYQHAVRAGYRFYSYGDCMLIR